jgi:small subunit ribosomal protein S17
MAKMIIGTVASKKTDKTIVVQEHVRLTHPLYRKQYTVTKRFMAHDENNEAQEGDKVAIVECRPLSARKRFTLDRVIEKAAIRHVEPEVTAKKAKAEKPAEAVAADTKAEAPAEGEAA